MIHKYQKLFRRIEVSGLVFDHEILLKERLDWIYKTIIYLPLHKEIGKMQVNTKVIYYILDTFAVSFLNFSRLTAILSLIDSIRNCQSLS